MGLTETPGSTSVTAGGGEITLYDSGVVTINHFGFTIFLDPLAAADVLTIKVYKRDATAGTLKLVYTFTYSGVTATACEIPYISTTNYKVTATLTGTTRTLNWNRYNF